MNRALLLAATVSLLPACDPIWQVNGDVTSKPGAAAAVEGAVSNETGAVRDATITLVCPGWTESATTDFVGRFTMGGAGWVDFACKVRVEKAGFVTQEIEIEGACTAKRATDCAVADVKVELATAQ